MTPNIFLIVGRSNSGKTEIINKVYECLTNKKLPSARDKFPNPVTINNVKIGFCSVGDATRDFDDIIKKLRDEKCDLIICACRTRGATLYYYSRMQNDYTLHPIFSIHEDDLNYREINTRRLFSEIANKLQQLYKIQLTCKE